MNSKSKKALLSIAMLWMVGIMVWPGCVTAPLPARREPIASRKKSDFKWLKCAHPTRDEIISKLGEPDASLGDLHVACYRINKVTHHKIVLLLGVIPVYQTGFRTDLDVAFIEFDDQDRAQRYAVGTLQDFRQIEKAVRKWVEPITK